MDELEKLSQVFTKFPGVGPRQAKRMTMYVVRQRAAWVNELAELLTSVRKEVHSCPSCLRHFMPKHGAQTLCNICGDPNRTNESLIVIEKDVDLDNIERSDHFSGKYFVVGGLYAPLKKEPEAFMRLKELMALVHERKSELREITLALAANSDGEETARFLQEKLQAVAKENNFIITTLGRGLSTGSELEYADPATIRSAFEGRK